MKNMKNTLAVLFVCLISVVATAQQIRPITQINDINMVGQEYNSKPVTWFAGDSIKFDVYARDVRVPINLSGIVFPVLFVAAETNHAQVYIAATGTVVSATNGHVSVAVTAANALLNPSVKYAAWMTVFRVVNGGTNEVATVAYSAATVKQSPAGTTYTYLPPSTSAFTFVFGDFGDPATWSEYAATDPVNFGGQTISNIGGIAGAVTFASQPVIPGYATGTPVYVESDPVWNAQKAGYATGTPLYVESDPVWSAASNSYFTASQVSNAVSFWSTYAASGEVNLDNKNVNNANYISGYRGGFIDYADHIIGGQPWTISQQLTVTGVATFAGSINPVTIIDAVTISGSTPDVVVGNSGFTWLAPVFGTQAVKLWSANGGSATSVYLFAHGGGGLARANETNGLNNSLIWDSGMEVLETKGRIVLRDPTTLDANITITATGGLQVGQNSFYAFPSGDIQQDATNTALLGHITANSINVTGITTIAGYATGTPIYTVSGLATGTPLYEVDLSPYATGTPIYSVSGLATGTPIYTVSGLATGSPLYEIDLSPYATGTPIYSVSGLATGTPIYSVSGLATGTPLYEVDLSAYATGTPVYSISGLATGTPLYEVDLSPYATGTPVYSIAGLATGTPLYEVDLTAYATGAPLYEIDLTPYATGTPIYSVAGLATGTPIYSVAGLATGTPIYSIAGLATGSPLYEVDLTPYATGTPIYSVSGLATGTPLYEVDLTPYATGTPIYSLSGYATNGQWDASVAGASNVADAAAAGVLTVGEVATNAALLAAEATNSIHEISTNYWGATNDGAGSGLDADKLDGLEGAAYHTLTSFQAYTTNAIKFFVGNVTSGQGGAYGSITANRTNGTTWISLGSTNWIKITGAINEF